MQAEDIKEEIAVAEVPTVVVVAEVAAVAAEEMVIGFALTQGKPFLFFSLSSLSDLYRVFFFFAYLI